MILTGIARDGGFGTHPTIDFGCGPLCTFNYDSLISSGLAILVTIGVAFWIRSQLQAREPSKVQAIFEWGYDLLRGLIKENVDAGALFIVPLALTLFLYILVANWLEILPLGLFPILHGANADVNQTLAMALIVIALVQWYSVQVLGARGYLLRFTKPFELPVWGRAIYTPLNVLEELVKPVTLSLRLFGNIFAGGVMIALIATLGTIVLPKIGFLNLSALGSVPMAVIATALLALWKAFDVIFIGFIQAFIFMLLTVIYFGAAREGFDHLHHEREHTTSETEEGTALTTLTAIDQGGHS